MAQRGLRRPPSLVLKASAGSAAKERACRSKHAHPLPAERAQGRPITLVQRPHRPQEPRPYKAAAFLIYACIYALSDLGAVEGKQRSGGRGDGGEKEWSLPHSKSWALSAWMTSASFHLQNRIKGDWSLGGNLTPPCQQLNTVDCFFNFKF